MAVRQGVSALVVPDLEREHAALPQPSQSVDGRDLVVAELPQRLPARGNRSAVVLGQAAESVQQQVAGRGRELRREWSAAGGPRDVDDAHSTVETSRELRCREGVQIRLPGHSDVQRLQSPGGREQQRCRLGTSLRGKGQQCADHVGLRPLSFIGRPIAGGGEQSTSDVESTGLHVDIGRRQRTPYSLRRVRCQIGRPGHEGSGRDEPTTGLGAARRTLEFGGHLLVGLRDRPGAVPGASIGIELGIRRLSQSSMDAMPVVHGGGAVAGGSDQRMGELHPYSDLEQPGVHRRGGGTHVDTEEGRGTAEQHHIAERFGGSRESQQPGVGRESQQACEVAELDLADHRMVAGEPESSGHFRRGPGARQFQQREGVAVAFRDDLVGHFRIERTVHTAEQERAGIAIADPGEQQRRQAFEEVVTDPGPRRADEADPLGEQPAGDEAENLRRRLVQPLRILDEADQRSLFGGFRDEGQRRQCDQEPIGNASAGQPEHRRERVTLRSRQPVEMVQERGAQLMETAVGQLHLRLQAGHLGYLPAGELPGQIAEQCCLPDARVATQYQDPARAGQYFGDQPVECLALAAPSQQPRVVPPHFAPWGARVRLTRPPVKALPDHPDLPATAAVSVKRHRDQWNPRRTTNPRRRRRPRRA